MQKVKNIKILKFGGAALSHLFAFDNMLSTLKQNQENNNILLVVSAFSKTTKKLRSAAELAESGNLDSAVSLIDEIALEYECYADKLINDKELCRITIHQISEAKHELHSLLKGVSIVKELTARTLDKIMSYGEKLSLLIAFHFINIHGVNAGFIDSSNIIITNSNYGQASPILSATESNIKEKLIPMWKEHKVLITQGFVAANAEGITTTMGIESSNLTAAIYAKYLNCSEIVIFSDVNGIRSADPKVNADTHLIDKLSYKQAYLLGKCGLKLIFPKMIKLAAQANIHVIIKSGIESSTESTIISSQANEQPLEIVINNGETRLLKVPFSAKDMHFTLRNGKIAVPSLYSKTLKRWLSRAYNGKIDDAKFKVIAIDDAYILIELGGNASSKEITKCEKQSKVRFNSAKRTQSGEEAYYRISSKSIETSYYKL